MKGKERKLTIYPIPPYSPELNIIEIVWRKIKYEWLPFSAYESFISLEEKNCLMCFPISGKLTILSFLEKLN